MDFLTAVADEAGTAFVSEFAERGVWTPAGGAAVKVCGIFDRISEVTDIGEMIQMDGVAAMYTIETAAFPGVALGDLITARGEDYRVVGVEPDGTGNTKLILGI